LKKVANWLARVDRDTDEGSIVAELR